MFSSFLISMHIYGYVLKATNPSKKRSQWLFLNGWRETIISEDELTIAWNPTGYFVFAQVDIITHVHKRGCIIYSRYTFIHGQKQQKVCWMCHPPFPKFRKSLCAAFSSSTGPVSTGFFSSSARSSGYSVFTSWGANILICSCLLSYLWEKIILRVILLDIFHAI